MITKEQFYKALQRYLDEKIDEAIHREMSDEGYYPLDTSVEVNFNLLVDKLFDKE